MEEIQFNKLSINNSIDQVELNKQFFNAVENNNIEKVKELLNLEQILMLKIYMPGHLFILQLVMDIMI